LTKPVPETAPSVEPEQNDHEAPAVRDTFVNTFAANSRAAGVFEALFHDPSALDVPGEIDWTDFVYAMTHVGFSAYKVHGIRLAF
jgi:hypothetical protein